MRQVTVAANSKTEEPELKKQALGGARENM